MSLRPIILLIFAPLLMAAKTDPYNNIAQPVRVQLEAGLNRYVGDQIRLNWADLYEISIPGYAIEGDYDDPTGKNEPFLSKDAFIRAQDDKLESGTLPVMKSFELISITPVEGGFEIRGCSKAQRETFHFKGILRFNAYVSNGRVRFGAWSFVYAMPHSCSQTSDSY